MLKTDCRPLVTPPGPPAMCQLFPYYSHERSAGPNAIVQQEAYSLRCRTATLTLFVRSMRARCSFDDRYQPFREFALHHEIIH